MKKRILFLLVLLLTTASVTFTSATFAQTAANMPGNLLRNGSFEGGTRYWYETDDKTLASGDAVSGASALRIHKGGIQSAAFLLKNNAPVTISFSAKSLNGTATMGWQCTPAAREIGMKYGQAWGMRGRHPVAISPEWKRYTVSFTPTAPQDGFWPRPTYMLQLGDCDQPFLLDAVTVGYGVGEKNFVPYQAVEAQINCPDLPGFADPGGNTFVKGATVRLVGSVFNPGNVARKLTLRWRLFDYEGKTPVGGVVVKTVTVGPGKTVSAIVPITLSPTGMVLARFVAADGNTMLDRSDLPLTSLPYPKKFAKPDPRERFGASFFGPHSIEIAARLGFAWSRWFPHTKWQDHQPDGPDSFHWFDKELDLLESRGMSANLVLYGWPKWIMDEGKHPLPRDMRWKPDDPRWDDLSVQTAWDKYIVACVRHYKNRSVIFEIENEPEFDGWDNYQDEYAKFTARTARLIKQTDPNARVMINNVYGIPSRLNDHFLRGGGGKWVDIISWHDYHEGGLTSGEDLQRMKQRLESLGCGHIEIWFNEGWAFTNTADDEPTLALTNLTAAESANAIVRSVAELTVTGQQKTILFHSAYEDHGMSFWDYAGPGTMLWDYHNRPLPLVGAWNTLIHHIGSSDAIAWVRPPGASLCVFQDTRNQRGVLVAYADSSAKEDVTITLPLENTVVEDIMGNARPLAGKTLVLPKNGRPVFVYTSNKTPGRILAQKLLPLDRKKIGFVQNNGARFVLPPAWTEETKNPVAAAGKPIWRLDQVWPPDPTKNENFRPLVWRDGWWKAIANDAGDQPKAERKPDGLRIEFRATTGGSTANDPVAERIAGLVFIASQAGVYTVAGTAELKLWDGDIPVRLQLLRKGHDGAVEIGAQELRRDQRVELKTEVSLQTGDELVLLPRPGGAHVGGDITLRDLTVTRK